MDLYEAVETICKDYCKYPDIENGNRLADICDKCPMNKCEELRWADRKDEPTTQTETQNSNLTFEEDECAKEYEELGLKELKELINADRKTENSSEKPNNCEHITEDGVTCAKYPACDDCLDNPLNKIKGSERLVKGSEQTDCQTCKWWSSCGYCVHRECKGYAPQM